MARLSSFSRGPITSLSGYSFLSRRFGFASENILAVRAVLVNGDIVDCSPEEHTDLFWAMCGAGSAFAIAVELKLRLVDPPVRRPLGL